MRIGLSLFIATSLLAGACSPPGGPALDGRDFVLVEIVGWPEPLVAGTTLRLSFNDGQVGANAGCNHLAGSYELRDGRLLVAQLGSTEMGCDPARHAQDERVAALLSAQPTLRLEGDTLVLQAAQVVATLRDRRAVEPDLPLVGTSWRLVGIIEGDSVSSVPEDIESSLQLSADGSLSVRPGCNTGAGRYEATATTITFGPIALTRMACPGSGDQVEAAVMRVLQGEASYQIESGSLVIQSAAGGLMYSGR